MPTTCTTCNGTGYRSQFAHIEHGLCFHCTGGQRPTDTEKRAEARKGLVDYIERLQVELKLIADDMNRPLSEKRRARFAKEYADAEARIADARRDLN